MEAATYGGASKHSRGKALSRDANCSARHRATFGSNPSYGSTGNTPSFRGYAFRRLWKFPSNCIRDAVKYCCADSLPCSRAEKASVMETAAPSHRERCENISCASSEAMTRSHSRRHVVSRESYRFTLHFSISICGKALNVGIRKVSHVKSFIYLIILTAESNILHYI